MILITYIIILYLIVINFYFFNKRKYSKLYFENKWYFLKSFGIVLIFILYFVVFIRLMNLFRESRVLDLKYFFFNIDTTLILLSIILLYVSRRNFIFCVKMDCYRLHYYFMNNEIKLNLLKPYYNLFFNKYFNSFVYFSYPIFYYINIIITTICYSMVIYDILLNNCVLYNSLVIIPYYSFFKIFYNLIWYFECKYHALYEYYVRNHNYMLFLESRNIISGFNFDAQALYLKYEQKVIRQI